MGLVPQDGEGLLVSAEAPHWVCWGKSNLEGLHTRNEGVVSHLGGALVLDRWVGWGKSAEECWGKGSGASPVDTADQKWHPTVQGQLGKKGNKKNGSPPVLLSLDNVPRDWCSSAIFPKISQWIPFMYNLGAVQTVAFVLGLRVSGSVYVLFESGVSISTALWFWGT